MSRPLALGLLLALAASLAGCAAAVIGVGGAAAYSALEDRRTTGAQLEDETIELRASDRIVQRFGEAAHVNVTSFNRVVLLTGEVADAARRAEIERIVQALPNVRSVANELEIAGVSSLTARTNDSLITSNVKLRFLDAEFKVLHVKVVTEAGVVYLMGIVTEKEAGSAVELARTTGGVRKVVKVFEYCRPTDDVCRPPAPPAAPRAHAGG
jgi:osmotically-inducible protein OsmY